MNNDFIKYEDTPQWISVKDRLPENDDTVLVVLSDTRISLGNKDSDGFWDYDGLVELDEFCITHWMPLPGLPEES